MLSAQLVAMKSGRNVLEGVPKDARRLLSAALLTGVAGIVSCPAQVSLWVSEKGTLPTYPVFGTLGGQMLDRNLERDSRDSWSAMLFPALLALSFMNCKNVTMPVVEPDARINRERQRHGLNPFLRYHAINIEPMKQVLRTEGVVVEHGLKRALHICRGHFATYSADKPLFGHFSGTVWQPAHVRGHAKQGVVFSDYSLNSPTTGSGQ